MYNTDSMGHLRCLRCADLYYCLLYIESVIAAFPPTYIRNYIHICINDIHICINDIHIWICLLYLKELCMMND